MQQGDTPYSQLPPPTGAPVATTAAPPPPIADRRVPCPRCGEPAEPGQEVCLRCGALVGRIYRRPPSWRVPAALAALGVLLIGAGAGFGIAELSHDDDDKKPVSLTPERTTAATPPPTPAPEPPPTTAPPTTSTTPPPTTTDTAPESPSGGAAANAVLIDWPSGKSGWTVQLATFDDRGRAQAEARKAAAQSISAGVLEGAKYQGLGKDQWVVFMGQYDSREAARVASRSYAEKGFRGDVRRVKPKK